MYVGHLAVALASVRYRPRIGLATLLLASQGPDWIQLALSTFGSVDAQLQSHSLPAVAAGAFVFAVVAYWPNRAWGEAMLVAGVYLTHPVLDLVTGLKPLWPGGRAHGADLYLHPGLDFIAEASLVLVAWLVYRRSITPPRRSSLILLIPATLIICQAVLDVGQELRLVRNDRTAELRATEHNAQSVRNRPSSLWHVGGHVTGGKSSTN